MSNAAIRGDASVADEARDEGELEHLQRLFFSRLDERQQRWYAGLEARRMGHGGTVRAAQRTGLDVKTIRRGRCELEAGLQGQPSGRIRRAGGGRRRLEKKA